MNGHFTGGQKKLDHFLRGYEQQLIRTFLPLVPSSMSTVHLTLLTFLWAALVVVFGRLAGGNIHWLWGSSVCIFLQHITDMLDGEVGRVRNEGLVKWGFYMDHFLDYVFLCAIIVGYSFLLPPSSFLLSLLCLAIFGAFMVHVLLDFAITRDFKISFNRFGVAEMRYVSILLNVAAVLFGKKVFADIFLWIVLASFAALIIVVCTSQKNYGLIDRRIQNKNNNEEL